MGDAAGIGPEIVMRALAHADLYRRCRPLVVGAAARLRRAAGAVGSHLTLEALADPQAAHFTPGTVDCVDLGLIPEGLPWGKVSAIAGDAAYRYVEHAVALAMARRIDAICTAPLNKEALQAGGHAFPGHTEILAHLTGTDEVSMLLMTPTLKVIHVTAHIGLMHAHPRHEAWMVEGTNRRGHAALVGAGIARPRIGVCGINPHAGENGLFGYGEEEEKIAPAIERLMQDGLAVTGPLPADTLFFRAQRGDFDLVVAMYHDQGHGPVKVMGIDAGVNVTVGLPVVRTSVDHGTAFDIAGTGTADEASLIEAINQAVSLSAQAASAREAVVMK